MVKQQKKRKNVLQKEWKNKMEKKNFITLVLGSIGGFLFAIGMCMCLLPEWNAFKLGIIFTATGGVILICLGLFFWIKNKKNRNKT